MFLNFFNAFIVLSLAFLFLIFLSDNGFQPEINNSSDPVNEILNKEKEYSDIFANPYIAAERGFIDEIINPDETRNKIITSLNMLKNKVENLPKKKHGNIPL